MNPLSKQQQQAGFCGTDNIQCVVKQ